MQSRAPWIAVTQSHRAVLYGQVDMVEQKSRRATSLEATLISMRKPDSLESDRSEELDAWGRPNSGQIQGHDPAIR